MDIDLEIEVLHSSWMRNMFQMITLGIVLLTFFRGNNNLKKFTIIPIIIILIGIIIGIFSILYSYYLTNSQRDKYKWKYISGIVVIIFSSVAIYIVRYIN
tara:strand:- start:107 stop:406 length:300 start_codon:yes stop_codon:yes gene_type:complete